jgi:hypothetical protein
MGVTLRFVVGCSVLAIVGGCGVAPSAAEEGEMESVASVGGALSGGGLTREQAATAVDLIDDICGDSWCEGENDFEFRALGCSARTERCTLVFKIIPRDSTPGAPPFFWRSCTTGDFAGFESLVTTAENGYQALTPEYYDALTECISRLGRRQKSGFSSLLL